MRVAGRSSTAGPVMELWKRITKLEHRIEATMDEVEKPGYRLNMFGSFDREVLTAELLRLYTELRELAPHDLDVKYRHAGAAMRARGFDQARQLYTELLESRTPAHLMLAMLELQCGNREVADARLAVYNARCVSEGMPFMQSSIEKNTLRR